MPHDHLLAIPVFNEEQYLDRVLHEARRYSRHVLVIDDGSTDRTPQLLRRHDGIHVITHPENRGYGKSLADAFEFTRLHGYDWLITMDCDEQHEPSRIPEFVESAACNDADIISGTRYPNGHYVGGTAPADRREINRRITEMINRRLGLSITDAFCGFKAYRKAALERVRITIPGYAMPLQFWVQIARARLRIKELPVSLIYHDPTRYFGGVLDDPRVRFNRYVEVFEAELSAGVDDPVRCEPDCVPCR